MTRNTYGAPEHSELAWPLEAIQKQEHVSRFSRKPDCEDTANRINQLAVASKILLHAPQQPQQQLLLSADLAGVAQYILSGRAKKIVIMAGAGISVSSGIPDFRSPGTGLYSQLARFNLPWPEAVFDIRFFRHNPKPFYLLAKELFPGGYMPTPAHYFIKLLHDKGLLLTAFTQNIDGLEQLAGLPVDKVVPAHGSFDGAHCIDCGRPCSVYAVQQAVFDDEVAHCSSCGGLVKPDVVFFGEPLPVRFHRRRLADLQQADLLIVMGTSLVVQPFAGMIDTVPEGCPRLLINMKKVGERKQPQEETTALLPRSCKPRRYSSSSSSGASSSDGDDDTGSCSGFETDATGLTASSSCINIGCCSDRDVHGIDGNGNAADADVDADAGQQPSAAGLSGSSTGNDGGFDFSSHNCRDALHLGNCDAGVMQLAGLLGWQDELAALIKQGAEEFEASRREWDDS